GARLLRFEPAGPRSIAGVAFFWPDDQGEERQVTLFVDGEGQAHQQLRQSSGDVMQRAGPGIEGLARLRLPRLGSQVTGELLEDGNHWSAVDDLKGPAAEGMRAGLTVASGVDEAP